MLTPTPTYTPTPTNTPIYGPVVHTHSHSGSVPGTHRHSHTGSISGADRGQHTHEPYTWYRWGRSGARTPTPTPRIYRQNEHGAALFHLLGSWDMIPQWGIYAGRTASAKLGNLVEPAEHSAFRWLSNAMSAASPLTYRTSIIGKPLPTKRAPPSICTLTACRIARPRKI